MNVADLTSTLAIITWREPFWLLLAFVPLMVWWFRQALQGRQVGFAEDHLMPWIISYQQTGIWRRLFSRNSAFVIAWLLFGVAASGPRLPVEIVKQGQATEMNIMLVVDVSRSMQVTDVSPSRIRRAQIEIEELLQRAAGNRIGVIVFAARPHLLTPLTSDYEALRFYLHSLDSLILPTEGSEPTAALDMAYQELRDGKNPSAIIMLTDGDFATFPDTTISVLRQAKIPLYIAGIGSGEGEAIPIENGEWLHYRGRPVISRLNETMLRKMANPDEGEGINDDQSHYYSPSVDDDSDWQKLYDNGIARLAALPKKIDYDRNTIWQEFYHWPLFLALLLLWIALMPYGFRFLPLPPLGFVNRRAIHALFSESAVVESVKSIFIVSTIIVLSLYPQPDMAAANTASLDNGQVLNERQAFKNYSESNFSAALAIYKQLTGYAARLGEGSCHYRMSNYSGAIKQYTQAVLLADNDRQRAVALFNLGNSYFQTGNYTDAITVYEDAAQYQPGYRNVFHNLTFTRALKKVVDERLQQTTNTERMGSGPQLAPTNSILENNLRGSLALDESEKQEVEEYPLPELANISNAGLEALIRRGLGQIRLAAENAGSVKFKERRRHKLDYINARLRMTELEDQQNLLWKQLFEIEEGFPAPLTESRQIPGVRPW